jgi:hypothetical protein
VRPGCECSRPFVAGFRTLVSRPFYLRIRGLTTLDRRE